VVAAQLQLTYLLLLDEVVLLLALLRGYAGLVFGLCLLEAIQHT
jgi:hypothetical protein